MPSPRSEGKVLEAAVQDAAEANEKNALVDNATSCLGQNHWPSLEAGLLKRSVMSEQVTGLRAQLAFSLSPHPGLSTRMCGWRIRIILAIIN